MPLLLDLAEQRYALERRELVDDWSSFCRSTMPKLTGWAGQHSFTTAGRKPRIYCDAHVSSIFHGKEFPGMWEGELRRPYVDACSGGVRSFWSKHDERRLLEVKGFEIPHYFSGEAPDCELVSLDLDHAWWAFAEHFSTQVEYDTVSGVWGATGDPWQDVPELLAHKELRTVICQRGWRVKETVRWVKGEGRRSGNSNQFQPQAFRLLSDYLHAIAQEMVGLFGAVVVVNDEYAVPVEHEQPARQFLLERWGTTAKVAKRWQPGSPWPWVAESSHNSIRDQPDAKRQALAWRLLRNGPRDAPLFVTVTKKVWTFTPGEGSPAPTLGFHQRWGLDPGKPLKCRGVGGVRHVVPGWGGTSERGWQGKSGGADEGRRRVTARHVFMGEPVEVEMLRAEVERLADRLRSGP